MDLQFGIDTAAHNGAKFYKGKTIAVIGGGFSKIYPEENIGLFHEIVKLGGLIVSEYAPNTEPKLSNFPKRNRIISGLSDGVLVVEAVIKRSGSAVTARLAEEQGRKVFCIPSNLGVTTGTGTNKLIQSGAKLVMETKDVLNELEVFVEVDEQTEPEKEMEIKVEEEYKEIYEVLKNKKLNINMIAKSINKSIAEVNQKLGFMEIYGYVKKLPGNEYQRR